MKSINKFVSGIKKYRDPSMFKNGDWTFPSTGIRIMDYKDRGLAITFVRGNTYNTGTGEEFSLPSGYVPIGNETYNGVIYIVSVNQSGLTQIGTYPSPINWDSFINKGFVREYKVLKNFDSGAGRADLISDKFNFRTENQVDIVIKEIYDGSVNLYLADFINPNIVINTGFNQEGFILDNLILDSDFNGALKLIPTSIELIKSTLKDITTGGNLEYGMYHFYFRYKTRTKDVTRFISKLFPIQIFKGTTTVNIEGSYELSYNGNQNYSNKKVKVLFDNVNIDKGYEYLEIAVVRYTADENNGLVRKVYLIDKEYLISDILINPNIWIDGREPRVTLSFEEIILAENKFSICKSQAIVDSRYYGANWKGFSYDKNKFAEYAKKIEIGYAMSDTIEDIVKFDSTNPSEINQHKIYEVDNNITHLYTGYFRGETYPFAVKYLMTDGSFTEGFPMKGYFERLAGSKLSPNEKGIYTFPFYNNSYIEGAHEDVNDRHKAMGVKFDNTAAITYLNENEDAFRNVVGIVFMRGEQIENIIYQGLGSDVAKGQNLECKTGGSSQFNYRNSKRIALPYKKLGAYVVGDEEIEGDYKYYGITVNTLPGTNEYRDNHGTFVYDTRLRGLFAPDFMFEDRANISIGESVVAIPFLGHDVADTNRDTPTDDNSGFYRWKYSPGTGEQHCNIYKYIEYSQPDNANTNDHYYGHADLNSFVESVEAYPIEDGTINGHLGLATLTESVKSSDNLFTTDIDFTDGTFPRFTKAFGLSMRIVKHIGLKLKYEKTLPINTFRDRLVNIYKNNPTIALYSSIVASFNVGSELYSEIDTLRQLGTNTSTEEIFKGDCFLQRVSFRVFRNYAVTDYSDVNNFGGTSDWEPVNLHSVSGKIGYLNFGGVVSDIFELKHNLAMRNEVEAYNDDVKINYTYYPKIGTGISTSSNKGSIERWVGDMHNENNYYEAFHQNFGYDKILADSKTIGISSDNISYVFKRSTRIFFSPKSNSGEVADNFRKLSPIAYQDFPLENGPINAIAGINDILVSVQDDAINQHKLGQQELSSNASDIVLQNTGMYLSDSVRQLAKYGSQHQWGVMSIGNGLFGVDFKKRIIWATDSAITNSGSQSYNVTDISEAKEIFGWVKAYFAEYSDRTDIIDMLRDNPINGFGINLGYNRRFKEVNITFHFSLELPIVITYPDAWSAEVLYYPNTICSLVDGFEKTHIFILLRSTPLTGGTGPVFNLSTSDGWMDVTINGDMSILTLDDKDKINEGTLVKVCNGNQEGLIYVSPLSRPNSEEELKFHYNPGSGFVQVVNYFDIECPIEELSETLVFDNSIKAFVGNQPYTPSMYFHLGENMFSNPEINKLQDRRNLLFLHDNKDSDIGRFYGEKYDGKFSFIVNGTEETREVMKMFTAYSIDTEQDVFSKIEFFTDYQSSKIDPFIPTNLNLFYIKPQYLENMWRGPIKSNDNGNSLYSTYSEMRGTWLKVTLTYNENSPKFIRKVLTDYILSYI